ncbi:ead/Ea22-like family protein [Citrobacter freundii]|uniref:ead/Ea22-like family protein n=1 Tax=Citrobacter freundii TaxID=546 RepID=UPI001919D669|nr:ead/Ea22-like family protein [Citrobacter freundii]
MTALNKQALREVAEKTLNARARLELIESIFDDDGDITSEAQEDIKICTSFNDITDPATVLALLGELEAAEELVELQRFKLERQAEDLHQAKSLESIHWDKRLEVEREFRDYKDRAESNQMRLAKEVCRFEDELQAAGIGVKGK